MRDIDDNLHQPESALGRISYHWNTLHGSLQFIFVLLISERGEENSFDLSPGIELWQNQKSDDGQRALLKIYAESKLKSDPELRDAIAWVVDEVGKLSTYRNDATHSIFMYAETTTREIKVNHLFTAPSRAARLVAAGHADLFKCLICDLYLLDIYATKIKAIALAPEVRPNPNLSLSDRPTLLSALLVARSPLKSSPHQSRTEGQQDQPPSSAA